MLADTLIRFENLEEEFKEFIIDFFGKEALSLF